MCPRAVVVVSFVLLRHFLSETAAIVVVVVFVSSAHDSSHGLEHGRYVHYTPTAHPMDVHYGAFLRSQSERVGGGGGASHGTTTCTSSSEDMFSELRLQIGRISS